MTGATKRVAALRHGLESASRSATVRSTLIAVHFNGRRTISALKSMDVDHVVPLHCTGELFHDIAKAEIPDRLIRAYTGTRLTFGVSEQ